MKTSSNPGFDASLFESEGELMWEAFFFGWFDDKSDIAAMHARLRELLYSHENQ